jgi:hypothetical protein
MDTRHSQLRIGFTLVLVGVAILQATNIIALDTTTAVLLAAAAVPWLQPLFKSVELLGVKFELQELESKVRAVGTKVSLIEDNSPLPGKGQTALDTPGDVEAVTTQPSDQAWESDPNRGRFGSTAVANDRRLEATIRPAAGPDSAACEVTLTVRSTDSTRPLNDPVIFHLHPTFGTHAKYTVKPKSGLARDSITSWGTFTVGVEADQGQTRLELDLSGVPGGTPKFYSQ